MTPTGAGAATDLDAVRAADARAAAWVRRAGPVRFGVAVSPHDLESIYRLRCEAVVRQGWAPPAAFPDGLERDADDAEAVQVAGWYGNRVVAGGRLVLARGDRPLPTEAAFDLVLPDREQLVDVGRVCVAPAHIDRTFRVFHGLLGQIWGEMRLRGVEEAATVVTQAVARLYERWGCGVTILGPPRRYWGQLRFPARIAPAAGSIR